MKKFIFLFLLILQLFPFATKAQGIPVEESSPVVVTDPSLVEKEDEFFRAKVLTILKESQKEEFNREFFVQDVRIEITGGPEKGKQVELQYEISLEKQEEKLKVGDGLVLARTYKNPEAPYYISDVYRLRAVWFIALFFFLVTVFFARMQGFRAFLGLALSFAIIAFFILPLILKGVNPLTICLVGALGIVCTTLYLAHGFHVRTTVAFASIVLTLGIAAVLSWIFVYGAKLSGIATEEAFFLQTSAFGAIINVRGLLLGGILLGTLGVLDDVATAQAATVEQIHKANPALDFHELYKRGLAVGREHIVSLVNTLVLAYTGASFPLLLLFVIYEKPLWVTLNSEIITEEVIRMLVGSIALVFAVPITTFFAAYIFGRHKLNSVDKSN